MSTKMNYTNRYCLILLLGFFLSTSCTDDFGVINTDPTALNELNFNPNTLLTSIQLSYSSNTTSNLDLSAGFIQHFANASTNTNILHTVGDKYLFLNHPQLAGYWESAYTGRIKPVVELLELTQDKPEYANLHQIGRLMKAMIFQRITDLYGDVPYFQAGLAYHERIFYPEYDSQELIYADILKEIEEATNALNPAGDRPTHDAMYFGDIDKWKRFGNTLLLRAGMRLVKVDEEAAQATVTKVLGNTMSSIEDNAFIRGSGGDRTSSNNANARYLLGDSGFFSWYLKWSKPFIDQLKNNNDPRLTRVASVNVWVGQPGSTTLSGNASQDPALQKGLPNGLHESPVDDGFSVFYDPSYSGDVGDLSAYSEYSSVSPVMMDRHAPTFFLTFAESELLLAEAAARWGTAFGNPQDHYDDGVKASMTSLSQFDESLAVSDAEVNTYLTNNPFDAANGLEMINIQHWVETGSKLNFHEAWINWRRSGFPVLVPVNYPGNVTGGIIPRRYIYPLSEAASNTANLEAARNSITGGDELTSRVWWDAE